MNELADFNSIIPIMMKNSNDDDEEEGICMLVYSSVALLDWHYVPLSAQSRSGGRVLTST